MTPAAGRSPRRKGNRAERALVKFLQECGFRAERIPLSGSAGGSFCGDVRMPLLGVDRRVEVKVRGNGFRELYAWLDARDLLVLRADRREPLVVLPLKLAADIAAAAEQARRHELRTPPGCAALDEPPHPKRWSNVNGKCGYDKTN